MKVSARLIRIGMAVLAAAAFGSVVTVLITETANPVRDGMFALSYPTLGIAQAVEELPSTFVWAFAFVALIGPGQSRRNPLVIPADAKRRAGTAGPLT